MNDEWICGGCRKPAREIYANPHDIRLDDKPDYYICTNPDCAYNGSIIPNWPH